MNVLYISYDGMTDNLGQSQVIPYLKGLTGYGHHFDIISCEKPDKFKAKEIEIRKLLDSLNIGWYPLPYTKRPPVLSTVIDVVRMYRKAYSLHKENKYDAVHCRSYLSAMIGQDMKKKFGTKFIFDMRGFWPDERIDGDLWNIKNPVYRIIYNYFKKKELQFFNESDLNVSLTHAGLNEIKKMNVSNEQINKFSIIPCCSDYELFKPLPRDLALVKQLGFEASNKILCYLGSIGTWYMFDEMMAMFKQLHFQDNSFRLFIMTPEPPSMVFDSAKKLGINTDLIKVVSATRQQVPKYLSIAHLGISFIKPCFSKLSSSPTKMGEMLAAGVPLICNSGVGDVERIINETKTGVIIHGFTEDEMQSVAKRAIEMIQVPRENIREQSRPVFALESGVKLYAQAYEKMQKQ
ncbi:MAG TPA: glycosyltransferase [Bacteroidia bacterium]|nr:glycosyltransferase [Bacteroidia bacterium]QQR94588.1 MAG: glycosyltransferase [Bacteroidota bacterium]MBP7714163.1 glycosyltransferase [Bacteroidia bacterium]MBP8668817.1 glycosyltransferase [Bacteroidia bacterium]HOZ82961.1 glycosyltransferase [Bacteroidia bacterium]